MSASPSAGSFRIGAAFRKNAQRLRALSHNPSLLPLWLSWQRQRLGGRDPVLSLFGFRFAGFYDFNAFAGAYHYRPDAAERAYFARCAGGAATILDVGANMGYITLLLARASPSGTVHAFEPHPRTAASLSANVDRNAVTNVRVHRLAVGSEDGTVSFTDHGVPASNRIGGGPGSLEVPATRLDRFAADNGIGTIDFLKIDVEGAELDVLEGARALFERRAVRSGLIEICPANLAAFGASVDDMVDWMSSVGYALCAIGPDGSAVDPVPRGIVDPLYLADAAFFLRGSGDAR